MYLSGDNEKTVEKPKKKVHQNTKFMIFGRLFLLKRLKILPDDSYGLQVAFSEEKSEIRRKLLEQCGPGAEIFFSENENVAVF